MARGFVCLGCQKLQTGEGPRCGSCSKTQQRERNRGRYDGERDAMRKVRREAAADPYTVCHLCGSRTPPEVYRSPPGWVADHDNGRLLPAHGGCNSAKGGRTVAQFRKRLLDRLPHWQT